MRTIGSSKEQENEMETYIQNQKDMVYIAQNEERGNGFTKDYIKVV